MELLIVLHFFYLDLANPLFPPVPVEMIYSQMSKQLKCLIIHCRIYQHCRTQHVQFSK